MLAWLKDLGPREAYLKVKGEMLLKKFAEEGLEASTVHLLDSTHTESGFLLSDPGELAAYSELHTQHLASLQAPALQGTAAPVLSPQQPNSTTAAAEALAVISTPQHRCSGTSATKRASRSRVNFLNFVPGFRSLGNYILVHFIDCFAFQAVKKTSNACAVKPLTKDELQAMNNVALRWAGSFSFTNDNTAINENANPMRDPCAADQPCSSNFVLHIKQEPVSP